MGIKKLKEKKRIGDETPLQKSHNGKYLIRYSPYLTKLNLFFSVLPPGWEMLWSNQSFLLCTSP